MASPGRKARPGLGRGGPARFLHLLHTDEGQTKEKNANFGLKKNETDGNQKSDTGRVRNLQEQQRENGFVGPKKGSGRDESELNRVESGVSSLLTSNDGGMDTLGACRAGTSNCIKKPLLRSTEKKSSSNSCKNRNTTVAADQVVERVKRVSIADAERESPQSNERKESRSENHTVTSEKAEKKPKVSEIRKPSVPMGMKNVDPDYLELLREATREFFDPAAENWDD